MPNKRNRSSDRSTMSDWGDTARDNPVKTAAAAAGAVAAGVFLWSKRNEISDQISRLSDQVSNWADEMRSGTGRELAMTEGPNESSAIESSRSTPSRSRSSRSTSKSSRASSGQSRTAGANMNAGRSGSETLTH